MATNPPLHQQGERRAALPRPAQPRYFGPYPEIVDETAEYMASYSSWDTGSSRYVLDPPLIPAQEGYWPDRERVINPTFELAYWQWALSIAQKTRERLAKKNSQHPSEAFHPLLCSVAEHWRDDSTVRRSTGRTGHSAGSALARKPCR